MPFPDLLRLPPRSLLRSPVFWAGVGLLVLAALGWRFRESLSRLADGAESLPGEIHQFPSAETRPQLPERGTRTTEGVLAQLGPVLEPTWRAICEGAGVAYPPSELVLLGFKRERTLHLYARDRQGAWKRLRSYPVLAASGQRGPKLREGDMQVPEGQYALEYLNPNSLYHLSFKLNYPTAQEQARGQTGSDIMVHGRNLSAGCLAMGDPAMEEILVLTAQTGLTQTRVVIAPRDFRHRPLGDRDLAPREDGPLPEWTAALYAELERELAQFPAP